MEQIKEINQTLSEIHNYPNDDILEDCLGEVMESHNIEQPIMDKIYEEKELMSLEGVSDVEDTILALKRLKGALDLYYS